MTADASAPRARFPAVPPPASKYYPPLRDLCLSMPGAWEDYPWGETVFKGPNNKIFASFYQREDGALGVGMRVSLAEQGAVTQIPGISVAAYSGKYGGITAIVSDEASYELVRDLILISYHHVNPRKKARARRG
ncbi:MAG TPA: MmcQ/YjbR family DNA-binding protein [Dehalococcoidia bacterium]|nr:MmcQ/YjbR family DNA-binding protein [Dehalococcoidia bacterium]